MANISIPFDEELLRVILEYPYSKTPFESDMAKEHLEKITTKNYDAVLKQIWGKITQHIQKKQDETVFRLIEKCITSTCTSVKDFVDKGPYDLLLNPRTLKNSLTRRSGTEKVQDLFKAFAMVVENENDEFINLKRVQGFFNIYNLHNTNKGKYQFSNLYIGLGENDSFITYFSRRYKKESKRVKTEIIGNDKLLVTLHEDNCFLVFYAFIGALAQPKLIQASFMYNNGLGHTMTGLAIFQKIKTKKQWVEPLREEEDFSCVSNEILSSEQRESIKYFLSNRGQIIKPKLFTGHQSNQPIKFTFNDLNIFPGPYNREALYYEDAKQYIGKYHIYFNERFPSVDIGKKRGNDFFSTIGQGLLEIYLHPEDGSFRCRMKTKKNKKEENIEYDGYIMNDELKSPSYLIISMYEKKYKHRFINLFLMKTGGDILLGSHNIMYSRVGELGVGSVVVVRKNNFDFDKENPEAFFSRHQEEGLLIDVINNYLSRNSNALLSPITDTKKLFNEFTNLKYSGIYKMYSYNQNGIRVGILEINKSGFVKHLGVSGSQKTTAFGQVTLVRSVLNILLKNSENQRTGFCCVKVAEVPPSDSISVGNRPIYVGTFSGVTRRNGEFPLASTIILEFMGNIPDIHDLEPKIITSNSAEYLEVPVEIRDALEFKHQAYIGFLRTRRGIYRLSDLKEFNAENDINKEIYLNTIAYNLIKEDSIFGEGENKDKFKRIEKNISKENEELSIHLYERAVYHAVIKNNPKEALRLYFRSKIFTSSPKEKEEQFKLEISNCDCLQIILNGLNENTSNGMVLL